MNKKVNIIKNSPSWDLIISRNSDKQLLREEQLVTITKISCVFMNASLPSPGRRVMASQVAALALLRIDIIFQSGRNPWGP